MEVLEQHSLQPYNTFGLEAKAAFFTEAKNLDDLRDAKRFADERGLQYLILGGGSNVLLSGDYDGLVVVNALRGITAEKLPSGGVALTAQSGENWHELVLHCVEQGYGGIENMSLIPGCVGAAPLQNIGAYGVELKDVFIRLEALNLETFAVETFDKVACQFGYRDSFFKREGKGKYWVTSITLQLTEENHQINTSYGAIEQTLDEWGIDQPTISDVSKAVIHIRQSRLPDPAVLGNSGSFFKNPVIPQELFESVQADYPDVPNYPAGEGFVKLPAAWLIEKCGWKGKRVGNTGCHEKQALVLVNHGGATGSEIMQLSSDIQASVLEQFQIRIEPEVNFI
ncbi:MAG: UDP-N-acetylmuramate dehydrogenase [Verrucomicrobiota bacterium]